MYVDSVYHTVYGNNLNTLRNRVLYCRRHSVGIHRIDDQYADVSGNQVLDVILLLCTVVAGICNRQLYSFFFRGGFRPLRKRYEKRVVQCGDRKSDGTVSGAFHRIPLAVDGDRVTSCKTQRHT